MKKFRLKLSPKARVASKFITKSSIAAFGYEQAIEQQGKHAVKKGKVITGQMEDNYNQAESILKD